MATIVPDIRGEGGDRPGAIEIRHMRRDRGARVAGFAFRCPCGCAGESWMPVRLAGETEIQGSAWIWNGDPVRPTLTPSILQSGFACKWHGYLTDGEFRSC